MIKTIHDNEFAQDVMADPYWYYGMMREEDPVHWNEKYDVWDITRHDDLVWVTRHHELFSSAVFKNDPKPPYPEIYESDNPLYDFAKEYQGDQFIQHDRPAHFDMRKIVHGYFTPKAMELWRPLVQSAIKELLDAAEEKGSMEVMRDFATPLPVLVIAQMMGVPYEDRPAIRAIAEKLLNLFRGEPDRMRYVVEGMKSMVEYVSPLVEERIDNPGDDFISVLANGEREGVFTRHQVLVNCSLLLLAGHETTINLLCNGTKAFLENRDQWELFQEDPAGMTVRATEECLRYDPPVKSITRIAAVDVEMRGKTLKTDERIRWFISSANRDPNMFDEPDTFDIQRHPNRHVAFGSGIHHCLGATLARLEGQEAFKALAERFPNMTLDPVEYEYQPTITFRSLKQLPVALN
jgi:cytochrome P450